MKAIALALALEGIARSPEPEQNPFTMKAIALALALALLATCSALPHGWRHSHRASPGNKLEVSFWLNLPSAGLTALEGELKARSDPSSALYAQWLSNAEVHAMVAPAPEAVNEVLAFLSDAGIEEHRVRFPTPNSDVLVLEVTVAEAERLLETEFAVYKHDGVGMAATRALQKEYALPARVARHVAFVGPVFGRLPQAQTASMVAAPQWNDDDGNPSPVNTPDTLRTLYNVGDTEGTSSTLQAVTAFLGQMYSASDLDAFWNKYAQYAETDVGLVGDATAGTPGGVESMLDIEYITGVGAGVRTEFWGFSGASPQDAEDEPFLTWLYQVGNTSDATVPKLFSTSYGEEETSELPSSYADRINAEFVKCGTRGITLLFASGDSGAVPASGKCVDGAFSPKWPATSPYVTAVGGTDSPTVMPETSWTYSSGGFSNNFPQQWWQETAVASYLKNSAVPSPEGLFNASGRGFPDIAAQAADFQVIANGNTISVAGTSCASPTAAAIFGLLNDARAVANKTSLGFLNPMLYANPSALNDCAKGTQLGCDGPSSGFPAVAGWDAVTGLGSPNYGSLLSVVMALP